jgi:anti-sigma regulatory factor (Ser/Thr protein kinase)
MGTKSWQGVIAMTAAFPVLTGPDGPLARYVRVFSGTTASVAAARRFTAAVLVACPAREALVACVSELAANAVVHTASGNGGEFAVEVLRPRPGVARIAVTDEGSRDAPSPASASETAEGGRGLALVAALAHTWGYTTRTANDGRTVWAEACWPIGVPDASPVDL